MEGVTYWTATNIYVTPTTLSGITFNFLMSLSGGLLAGYVIAKGDPFWTYSSGLAGVICASAGNDLYHPCLLYTSPSPRDGLLSRMPSSA